MIKISCLCKKLISKSQNSVMLESNLLNITLASTCLKNYVSDIVSEIPLKKARFSIALQMVQSL